MKDNNEHSLHAALDAEGRAASPQLSEDVKNFLIDIDGTITEDVPNEQPERMATCAPFPRCPGHIEWMVQRRSHHHLLYQPHRRPPGGNRGLAAKSMAFPIMGCSWVSRAEGNYHWIDNHVVRATRYVDRFTQLVKTTREIEVFKGNESASE